MHRSGGEKVSAIHKRDGGSTNSLHGNGEAVESAIMSTVFSMPPTQRPTRSMPTPAIKRCSPWYGVRSSQTSVQLRISQVFSMARTLIDTIFGSGPREHESNLAARQHAGDRATGAVQHLHINAWYFCRFRARKLTSWRTVRRRPLKARQTRSPRNGVPCARRVAARDAGQLAPGG